MVTTKHKYGWKIDEIIIFVVFTLGGLGFLLAALTKHFDLKGGIILAVLILLAGWGGTFLAAQRKWKSTLTARMDSKSFEAKFWMNKPNKAIWGTKLDGERNHGKLTDTVKISYDEVQTNPVTPVFTFHLKDRNQISLPLRLAQKPEVRDFLLALVEEMGGQVPADSEKTMNAYAKMLNHGRGIETQKEAVVVPEPEEAVELVETAPAEVAELSKPVEEKTFALSGGHDKGSVDLSALGETKTVSVDIDLGSPSLEAPKAVRVQPMSKARAKKAKSKTRS